MGLLSNRTVRSSLKPGDSDGDYGLRFNPPLPLFLSRPPIRTNGASNGSGVVKLSVPSPKISRSSSDADRKALSSFLLGILYSSHNETQKAHKAITENFSVNDKEDLYDYIYSN